MTSTIFPEPNLGTSDFWLRPLAVSDASEAYLGWLREAESVLGTGHLPMDIEALRMDIAKRSHPPSAYLFGIFLSGEKRHVGNISLHVDQRNQKGEVGILVDPERRGAHVATRAHILLLDWAFDVRNLRRITAGYTAANKASERLYRGLGFSVEGLLREDQLINGQALDAIRVAMLSREWHLIRSERVGETSQTHLSDLLSEIAPQT